MIDLKINNLKQSIEHAKHGQAFLDSLPSKALIELTQNCNLKCKMCPQSWDPAYAHYRSSFNMEVSIFRRIVDELFPYLIMVDLRGFGESLMHPEIELILDIMSDHDHIDWHLVSNLAVHRNKVWIKLMQMGFTVGASFDGSNQDIFGAIRGGALIESVLSNLRRVVRARDKAGSGHIYFLTTLQRDNLIDLKNIVEVAHQEGVREIRVRPILYGKEKDFTVHPPDLIKYSVQAAIDLADRYQIALDISDKRIGDLVGQWQSRRSLEGSLRYSRFWGADEVVELEKTEGAWLNGRENVASNQSCWKPYSLVYISCNGDVGPCNHMMYPNLTKFGNLKDSAMSEIWNSAAYAGFRRGLSKANPMDARCKWCFSNRTAD